MIFYFSGTGNTRWAAIRLASATQERLIEIAEEMRRMKTSGVDKTEPFMVSFSPFMVGGFQDLSGNL